MNNPIELLYNLIDACNVSKSRVSFVALSNYTNAQKQVQNTVLNVGLSYLRAKAKDIKYLSELDILKIGENIDFEKIGFDIETLQNAKNELLEALINPNENRSNGQIDAYTHLCNGLKLHNETKQIYLYGYVVSKTIVSAGIEKTDTRKPLTKGKDFLRKKLKSTKYRQFPLDNIKWVTLNKTTLEIG